MSVSPSLQLMSGELLLASRISFPIQNERDLYFRWCVSLWRNKASLHALLSWYWICIPRHLKRRRIAKIVAAVCTVHYKLPEFSGTHLVRLPALNMSFVPGRNLSCDHIVIKFGPKHQYVHWVTSNLWSSIWLISHIQVYKRGIDVSKSFVQNTHTARYMSTQTVTATEGNLVHDEHAIHDIEKPTPLPKFQIFIVYLIQFAEPITALVIYPFVNQFVRETGITNGDELKTGYYAGIIVRWSLKASKFILTYSSFA